MEQKIRALFPQGKQFSSMHGVPGLHAEVQAVNARLNQLQQDGIEITEDVLAEIQVATFRVTPKLPPTVPGKKATKLTEAVRFEACPHCTSILDGTTILTGTKP
jgi:hypothetical protein